MFKEVNQRNKRTLFLIWMASFLTLASLAVYVLYPYLNIYLVLNTFPCLFSACNRTPTFYGETIDMSQILPTSQHYVVNSKGQDLIDIAADLGINLVRITNIQRSFNNHADSMYTKAQWDQVLNKMQSKGIKALILIEVNSINGNYYTPQIQPIYLHLVQEYINSGVFSNPDVYGVDIKNEPVLTDDNLIMLEVAHTMIKAKYPELKQTVGWWATPQSPDDPYNRSKFNWLDYTGGRKIENIVDFYSVHMYGLSDSHLGVNLGPTLRTKVFLSAVEHGLQTKKPILIEEFGEANGDAVSDQDTIGSPELQANVYQGVYQALKEMHSSQIIGAVAFVFYSRSQYPEAWAIVKNNGNYLFPAAYILQEYALGKNDPSFKAVTVISSNSYLVRNDENHTTKNLHISDRIGLKLQLDHSKNYSLSLSRGGILQLVESLHYEYYSDSYYAVCQAVGKGSIQINIISHASSTTDITDTNPVYTLTLAVQ
jgi:hypothetical protein